MSKSVDWNGFRRKISKAQCSAYQIPRGVVSNQYDRAFNQDTIDDLDHGLGPDDDDAAADDGWGNNPEELRAVLDEEFLDTEGKLK